MLLARHELIALVLHNMMSSRWHLQRRPHTMSHSCIQHRLSPVQQNQVAESAVGMPPAADRRRMAGKSHLEVASCLLQLLLQAHHIDLVQSLVVLSSWGEATTLQQGAGAYMSGLMLTGGSQQQHAADDRETQR